MTMHVTNKKSWVLNVMLSLSRPCQYSRSSILDQLKFLWHLKIANYSFPGLAWTVQQQSPKNQTGSSGIWTQDRLHPKWKGKSFLRHFPGHSRGVLAGGGGVRCWGCSCCPPVKPRWLLSNLPTAKRSSFNYMFLRLSQISFRLIFRWSLLILN